jgi:hypothetical protein
MRTDGEGKLRCFLHYFHILQSRGLQDGVLTFTRLRAPVVTVEEVAMCDHPLLAVTVEEERVIEDARGALQVGGHVPPSQSFH